MSNNNILIYTYNAAKQAQLDATLFGIAALWLEFL